MQAATYLLSKLYSFFIFLLDFDYVHFSEKEAHNFDRLVDYLPWTILQGVPKNALFVF